MGETIIYARVSTDEQAKKGFSIPSQLNDCRSYCHRAGFVVGREVTDDETGAILDRDGLTQIREMVKAGAISRIVVWRQDRLARDEITYFTLRSELRRHGVEVHAVNRGGKVDGLYASLEAVLDADEKERIRDRTARGRKDKALRGKIIGHGSPPYGYTRIGDGEHIQWQIDETAADTIRAIFHAYTVELRSLSEIAVRLTSDHYPTPSQRRPDAGAHRKAPIDQWHRETVRWILRNPTYTGTFYAYRTSQPRGDQPKKRPPVRLRPRADWVPISVPAIIDQTTFDTAQRRLDTAPQLAFRNSKREYLIGRRVQCQCGRAATGWTSSLSGRNHKSYPYYSCNSRRHAKGEPQAPCPYPPFRGDKADAVVWAWVKDDLLVRERLHKHQQRREAEKARRAKAEDPAAQNAAKLDDARQRRDRLNRAYVAGLQSFEEYEPLKRAIDHEIAKLESETTIAPKPHVPASTAFIESLIDDYAEDIATADFALRRFIVDHLDIRVVMVVVDGKKHLKIRTEALDLETLKPMPE